MTGTVKKMRIQNPTDWQDIPEDTSKLPTDVLLLIAGPVSEKEEDYYVAFFSSKNKVFVGIPDMDCLSETFTPMQYHVLYSTKGETVKAYSED